MSIRTPKRRKLDAVSHPAHNVNGLDGPEPHDLSSNESPSDDDDQNSEQHGDVGSSGEDASDGDGSEPKANAEDGRHATRRLSTSKAHRQHLDESQRNIQGGPSALQLQVDDMLHQISPKYGRKEAPAEKVLRQVKTIIENIPDRQPLPVHEAKSALLKSHNICVPFPNPQPPKNVQYKLAFSKPSHINVLGSYALKTAIRERQRLSIDLVLLMPSKLFTEKDYLNHRYFHKRAYYLACIGAGIQDSKDLQVQVEFKSLNGNDLQPILVLRSASPDPEDGFAKSNCDIHIIPSCAEDLFPKTKTLPNRNCIRGQEDPRARDTEVMPPTPFYNSTLRSESTFTAYMKLLHGSNAHCPAFRDACLLGRVWLRQRNFCSSRNGGGFGHFEWAALVALLLQTGSAHGQPLLSTTYSSLQLFRATVQFLAIRDLILNPLVLFDDRTDLDLNQMSPVVFDGKNALNLLFKMSRASYKSLCAEARTTTKILGNKASDILESIFIIKVDEPLLKWDLLYQLPVKDSAISKDKNSQLHEIFDLIDSVLTRALGKRANRICFAVSEDDGWPLQSTPPNKSIKTIQVGIAVSPENAAKLVERGPPAEAIEEADAFKQFWGEKADLRRFKDGQILQSVVWDGGDFLSITQQIISFVLQRHIGLHVGRGDCKVLGYPASGVAEMSGNLQAGVFEPMMSSFRKLESDLRSLEGLPLQIRHIQAVGSDLRYASIHAPMNPGPNEHAAAEVLIQFEGSGRWPEDLQAISMTKIAFLLKVSDLLVGAGKHIDSKLGLEDAKHGLSREPFLDITYSSGASFRMRIYYDRAEALLERRVADRALNAREKEDAGLALAEFRKSFIRGPRLAQAMQTLTTRFPALSASVRLVKCWFNAHLLGIHFAEEFLEILAARTFLHSAPWDPPSSPLTCLLRTLLFLSRWDWERQPLLVDFGREMKPDEITAVNTRLSAWRKIDPSLNRLALFAATNFDTDGTTWTDKRPTRVVAARMSRLAKAAINAVMQQGLQLDISTLFKSPVSEYDVCIYLKQQFTKAKPGSSGKSKFKNLHLSTANAQRPTPAIAREFLNELERLYGDALMFFYDTRGGDVIAGVWTPLTSQRRWKPNVPFSSILVDGTEDDIEAMAAVNKPAVLNEIARLGTDIVDRIQVNRR